MYCIVNDSWFSTLGVVVRKEDQSTVLNLSAQDLSNQYIIVTDTINLNLVVKRTKSESLNRIESWVRFIR